jgi:V/A-type H+-transporting ATPase subunit I
MAVEKMSFVNIAGPIDLIDDFVINYAVPHEIQFEKAYKILDSVKGLIVFNEVNPYEPIMKKMEELRNNPYFTFEEVEVEDDKKLDIQRLEKSVDKYSGIVNELSQKKQQLLKLKNYKEQIRKQIIPIQDLEIRVDDLFHLKFMKFRFGKMPKDSFEKLQAYIETLEVIVFDVFEEEDEVFLIYFMPELIELKIDSLFASLYFTRIRISDDVVGYPKEALANISKEIDELDSQIKAVNNELENFYKEHNKKIVKLYLFADKLYQTFLARQYAARSNKAFYMTGWIADSHLKDFLKEIKPLKGVTCIVEEESSIKKAKPPTKLKNPKFFESFEMLVSMYGIPSYDEVDPTIFVAITYLLMFSIMFGDIGQGLVIALLGVFIYKKFKSKIGKLAIYLGIASMITGTIYGSIFADEEIMRETFGNIKFIDAMDSENMVYVLGGTIAFGVVIMIIASIINLMNAAKRKDYGRLLFDKNGVVGLVLYISLLYVGLSLLIGTSVDINLSLTPAIVLIALSLLGIFLSHPLQNFVRKKKRIFPEDKAGYAIESTFELVEVLLAIFSNTISFMRLGAFAMNHVGFSLAVKILAEMVGGSGSLLVYIFGNIFIIALEGMIVVIQCLRLEYYELFSRFFEGNGLEFKPFKIIKKLN